MLLARSVDTKRAEIKAVDLAPTTVAINNSTSTTLLNGMSIGANAYQRIGRKVVNKSLRFTGFVEFTQNGAAPSNDYMRVVLIYDKQPDGAAPAWSTVFTSVTSAGGTDQTSLAHFNLDQKDRFIILRDLRYKAEAPSGVAATQPLQVDSAQTECKWIIDEFVKLNAPTQYSATSNTGGVADIQTGALFVLTAGLLSAANSQFSLEFTSRVRYTDQ